MELALILRCLDLGWVSLNFAQKYRRMGRVEDNQALNALGIGRGKHPSDVAAPVIGHQDALFSTEMIEQIMQVSKQARHPICLDVVWRIGRRIAPKVWRDRQMVPAEFSDLGLVQRPAVGMAMQK